MHKQVDSLLSENDRLAEIKGILENLAAESAELQMVAPLKTDLDLLGGYESLTSFVGTVRDTATARDAAKGGLLVTGKAGKKTVVAIFVRNEDAKTTQSSLEEAGFAALSIPDCDGSVSSRMNEINAERADLLQEQESLEMSVASWSESNADVLLSGLELLERDQELATAPVRAAPESQALFSI